MTRSLPPAADDNDDAESALCFGAPHLSTSQPSQQDNAEDAASAVTCDFGAADESSGIHVREDGDLVEEEDDDDISPNDSVSNIGYSRPMRGAQRKLPRNSQRLASRLPPIQMDMPSIVEQLSAEQMDEDLIEGSPRKDSPRESMDSAESKNTFLRLGDLDAAAYQKLRRPSANDDGFSVVHQQHIAMRNLIPGDEMQVNPAQASTRTQAAGGRAPPPARSAGTRRNAVAAPALLDDDASSDVTFNFEAGPPPPQAGRSGRQPAAPMSDDDNSDAGSAVTFNFAFDKPKPSAKAAKGTGAAKAARKPNAKHREDPEPPPARNAGAMVSQYARGGRAPPAAVASDEDDEPGDEDDDGFTAVGLSIAPRDPYLGHLRGGGAVGGTHRKLQGPGGRIAHPEI